MSVGSVVTNGDNSSLVDGATGVAGMNAGGMVVEGKVPDASGDGIIVGAPDDVGDELIPGGGAYLVFRPGPNEKLDVVEVGGGAVSPPAPVEEGNKNTPGCGGPNEAREEVEDTVLIDGDLVAAVVALTS